MKQNAMVLNDSNPQNIANSVEILLNDTILYDLISKNAIQTIQSRFTLQQQLMKYELLYKSLHKHKIKQTALYNQLS